MEREGAAVTCDGRLFLAATGNALSPTLLVGWHARDSVTSKNLTPSIFQCFDAVGWIRVTASHI